MFSQVSVSGPGGVSASGAGGCLLLVPGGCLPLVLRGATPPWADSPSGRHPPGQTLPGQTPPQADTPNPCPVYAGIYNSPAQCMLGYTTPCPVHAGIHPLPLPSVCWDTVNKRAVRIPLECILVT